MLTQMRLNDDELYAKTLLAFLGLRRAERLGFEWSCVILTGTKPRIIVRQQLARRETQRAGEKTKWYIKPMTKTVKDREIPLFPPFLDALKGYKKHMEKLRKQLEWYPEPRLADLVFATPAGRPVTLNRDNDDLQDLFAKYRIRPEHRFRGHAARHITATLLADLTDPPVPEGVVRRILGHDSVAMTHYYVRVTNTKCGSQWRATH